MEGRSRIAVVTAGGPQVWALTNAMRDRLGPVTVILEATESRRDLLRKRARRFGWVEVAGQVGTMAFTKLRNKLSRARGTEVLPEAMRLEPGPDQQIVEIASADSPALAEAVRNAGAEVVLLNGCRMLSRATLAAMPCPVLNYHAGITPKYRGMNGGYWALASGDAGNFGTTVHLVDAGVDTGDVLYQVRGAPQPGDNITTYPMRLALMSADICIKAVEDVLAGHATPVKPDLPSQQWYHPTLWFYLWTGLTKRVW